MSDGIWKNFDVVKDELVEFKDALRENAKDQMGNIKRLLRFGFNPKDRETFLPHVLMAVVSTGFGLIAVFGLLRRTLSYLFVIYWLVRFLVWAGCKLIAGV